MHGHVEAPRIDNHKTVDTIPERLSHRYNREIHDRGISEIMGKSSQVYHNRELLNITNNNNIFVVD